MSCYADILRCRLITCHYYDITSPYAVFFSLLLLIMLFFFAMPYHYFAIIFATAADAAAVFVDTLITVAITLLSAFRFHADYAFLRRFRYFRYAMLRLSIRPPAFATITPATLLPLL